MSVATNKQAGRQRVKARRTKRAHARGNRPRPSQGLTHSTALPSRGHTATVAPVSPPTIPREDDRDVILEDDPKSGLWSLAADLVIGTGEARSPLRAMARNPCKSRIPLP